jgi:hypothetical protein
MSLGQTPEYGRLSAIGHAAHVAHYANINVGGIKGVDLRRPASAITRKFVKECARFVFDNFSNAPYPSAPTLVSRLYQAFTKTAVPRPNHGAGNHMRQLLFGLLMQTQMAQSCPRSYARILLLGSASASLPRESLMRRYLALSVAPLFYQVGRVSEAASQAMAVDQRDGSYTYVYRDVMGCRDARLLARLQKRYPQKLMNAAIVVSYAAYRAIMRRFLDPTGADADFGRFLSYVAAAGTYYLNHAPPTATTDDDLHTFILLNEVTMSGHYFDHCRGDFSMMLAPFGPFSHRGSGEYMLRVIAAEDGAFDEAAFRAEMEAVVITALSRTLDITGDTSGVQCHKAPGDEKKYPTVRSLRSYADTPERIALLTDFERVFHALFARRGGNIVNVALEPERLNPALRDAIRKRSVKVNMDANLGRVSDYIKVI